MQQDDTLKTRLNELEEDWSRGNKVWNFAQTTSEPARMRARMVVYADGTSWDPGSGEGLYRRNNANSAWVFIG